MPEFLELLPPAEALARLLRAVSLRPDPEEVQTVEALGRITVSPVTAPHPLPAFPRSTVDGYAVRATDTYGASDALPAYLRVAGEVAMGAASQVSLGMAECALIHTGGMLPAHADAVVMVEHTQSVKGDEVEILRPAAVGENVLKVGEDVAGGQGVVPAGTRIRPAEIGGLMALGITRLMVARRPRTGVLSSGDEIVPPETEPAPGQVRDVNSYSLSALVEQEGGIPVRYGIVPDEADQMKAAAARALGECELLLITAGSSASARDLTAQVINELGSPGVLVHGVNVRPGKPTILAVCNGKPVIGLPGNPVSALVIASLFVIPLLEAMSGLQRPRPKPTVPALLSLNLPSQSGREDWVAVRLLEDETLGEVRYRAEPVFGKSNFIFSLARADGLLRIDPDATGLNAGELVEVKLI